MGNKKKDTRVIYNNRYKKKREFIIEIFSTVKIH